MTKIRETIITGRRYFQSIFDQINTRNFNVSKKIKCKIAPIIDVDKLLSQMLTHKLENNLFFHAIKSNKLNQSKAPLKCSALNLVKLHSWLSYILYEIVEQMS